MAVSEEQLIAYLGQRAEERIAHVEKVLRGLTERELKLVREAAVMGFVAGRYESLNDPIPKDTAIIIDVVARCRSFPDLYPLLSGYRERTENEEGE